MEYQRGAETLQLLVVQYADDGTARAALQSVQQAKAPEVASAEQAGRFVAVAVGEKERCTALTGETYRGCASHFCVLACYVWHFRDLHFCMLSVIIQKITLSRDSTTT